MERGRSDRRSIVSVVALLGIISLGAYLRLEGLGVRSLWWDELCTWHVSRIGFGDSIRWGPELTQAPLYQLCVRSLTDDPHPVEWLLRMPAAVCGVLVIVAGWWVGAMAGGRSAGLALAGLLAVNPLQIDYSREARGYSMLVLGSALTIGLWYRLVTRNRRRDLVAYVLVATLAMHAHYLSGLTIAAQACWWLLTWARVPKSEKTLRPLVALVMTAALCVPVVWRHFYFQTSSFPGLEWIEAPSWSNTAAVIVQPSYGRVWIFVVLGGAVILWTASAFGMTARGNRPPRSPIFTGPTDPCGLLLFCWTIGWGGLLLISWTLQPAMVVRYALPTALPALLVPLIVAHRLDRRAPVILAAAFAIGAAGTWTDRQVDPGLRELAAYLETHVDRRKELVVLTMTTSAYHDWQDAERLGFEYYPMKGVPLEELHLDVDGVTALNAVLRDPRGLYLVVLGARPFAVLDAAGRQPIPIVLEGRSYEQLLFAPYRLVRVAPRNVS